MYYIYIYIYIYIYKEIIREISIKNVENECRIMEQNIKEWKEEIKCIEEKTMEIVQTLDTSGGQATVRKNGKMTENQTNSKV